MANIIKFEGGDQPIRGDFEVGVNVEYAIYSVLASFINGFGTHNKPPATALYTNLISLLSFLGAIVDDQGKNVNIVWEDVKTPAIPIEIIKDVDLAWIVALTILGKTNRVGIKMAVSDAASESVISEYQHNLVTLGFSVLKDKSFYMIDGEVSLINELRSDNYFTSVEAIGLLLWSLSKDSVNLEVNVFAPSYELISLVQMLSKEGSRVSLEDGRLKVHNSQEELKWKQSNIPSLDEVTFIILLTIARGGDVRTKIPDRVLMTSVTNILSKMEVEFRLTDGDIRVWRENASDIKITDITVGRGNLLPRRWAIMLASLQINHGGEFHIIDRKCWALDNFVQTLTTAGVKVDVVEGESIEGSENERFGNELVNLRINSDNRIRTNEIQLVNNSNSLIQLFIGLSQTEPVTFTNPEYILNHYPGLIDQLKKLGLILKVEMS